MVTQFRIESDINANEVIASRANELLGGGRQDVTAVRPDDDVIRCQSSVVQRER